MPTTWISICFSPYFNFIIWFAIAWNSGQLSPEGNFLRESSLLGFCVKEQNFGGPHCNGVGEEVPQCSSLAADSMLLFWSGLVCGCSSLWVLVKEKFWCLISLHFFAEDLLQCYCFTSVPVGFQFGPTSI